MCVPFCTECLCYTVDVSVYAYPCVPANLISMFVLQIGHMTTKRSKDFVSHIEVPAVELIVLCYVSWVH